MVTLCLESPIEAAHSSQLDFGTGKRMQDFGPKIEFCRRRLPRSRVHAASFETKGQPFYGWFTDGSKDKAEPVSNGLFFRL